MYGNYVKRLGSGSNNVFGSKSFNLIFLSNLSEWPVVELFTKSQLLISAVRSAAICFPFSSSAPTCRAVSLESELFEYIPVIWHRQSMLSMRKVRKYNYPYSMKSAPLCGNPDSYKSHRFRPSFWMIKITEKITKFSSIKNLSRQIEIVNSLFHQKTFSLKKITKNGTGTVPMKIFQIRNRQNEK